MSVETIVGMNAVKTFIESDPAVRLEAEDAIAFLAEINFTGGDATGPTAGVAEALAFGEVGVAAGEGLCTAVALGDGAVDRVDFGGVAFGPSGGADEGDGSASGVRALVGPSAD